MNSFEAIYNQMLGQGMSVPSPSLTIRIPNAERVLRQTMQYFLQRQGRQLQWLPEYDVVAEWLTDNQGRGLFMYGQCGRGKSLLGRYVLPAILLQYCNKVVTVLDMQTVNRDIDFALRKHLLSLDDVGTEELSVSYGERRLAFAELVDACEKQSKTLLVSTNLSGTQLCARYGDRTLDRIKATTRRVLFVGDSLRK